MKIDGSRRARESCRCYYNGFPPFAASYLPPTRSLVRKWCYAASSMPECHRPPLRHSGPPFVIPAKAGIQRGGEVGTVALRLVPSLGRAARSPKLH